MFYGRYAAERAHPQAMTKIDHTGYKSLPIFRFQGIIPPEVRLRDRPAVGTYAAEGQVAL
jgi:hypothetical protein